jgi:PmbA protein
MTNRETGQYLLDSLTLAGADKADCNVGRSRVDELNIINGEISLLRTIFSTSITMKGIKDNKHGIIHVNNSDKETLDKAICDTMEAVASSMEDEAEDIAEITENCCVGEVGEVDLEKLYDRLNELIEDTEKKHPKILLSEIIARFDSGSRIYMNTNGVAMEEQSMKYDIYVGFSAVDHNISSSVAGYGITTDNLDIPLLEYGILDQLMTQTEQSIYPKSLEGKFEGTIVLMPDALDNLLNTICRLLLSDGCLMDGTSQWKDALGQKVASPSFTLSCNYLEEGLVTSGSMITEDGYRKENLTVIEDGVLKSFLVSRFGSRKTGIPRSKNYGGAFVVKPGEKTLAEIIATIDKGILLGNLSGNQPTSSGEISGVAKGSFLIENGQLKEAINETMISCNLIDMLKHIRAVSKEQVCNGYNKLPWVAFDGVIISGK